MGTVRRRMLSAAAPPNLAPSGPAPSSPALDEASRLRLLGLGLDGAELDALDLREAPCALPAGWRERGNRLYCAGSVSVPTSFVAGNQALSSVSDCLMVLASPIDNLAALLAQGSGGTLYVGPECWLPGAQVFFGAGSSIILRALVTCTWAGILDARNGGTIFAERDQLWASHVYIATDDMHALRCQTTGERLNPHGAHIRLGSHVWVGRDSAITGNTTLGNDSVVGMRSVVRNKQFPANVAVAGAPARVTRTNITWSREDLP